VRKVLKFPDSCDIASDPAALPDVAAAGFWLVLVTGVVMASVP
jgi:hypothetical protein